MKRKLLCMYIIPISHHSTAQHVVWGLPIDTCKPTLACIYTSTTSNWAAGQPRNKSPPWELTWRPTNPSKEKDGLASFVTRYW